MTEGLDPARNIAVTISDGHTCFWCKKLVPKKLKCVAVTFVIENPFKDLRFTVYAHASCVEAAANALVVCAQSIYAMGP